MTRLSLSERLGRLLDELGIAAAHFCALAAQDLQGFIAAAPTRVTSVTMVGANAQVEPFAPLGERVLWICGNRGSVGAQMRPRLQALALGQVCWIDGYEQFLWSDTVAERTDDVAAALLPFLERMDRSLNPPSVDRTGSGEVAGVRYQAAGRGTPVVLLPLGLSARQWDALMPRLQECHCTILLGGPYLSPVENLESRAASGYATIARDLLDLTPLPPEASFIEVGCGSGALLRRIVRERGLERAVGLDINRFLLQEARVLVARERLSDRITLAEGSAEAIPLCDASFDTVFSSTVMEEVDADRMLAELVRIAKPGGSVAVIVRAVDRGQWTNASLPSELKQRIEASSGPAAVAQGGCADESLYGRLHTAGLKDIRGGPAWVAVRPTDPWWDNVDRQVRGMLTVDESRIWAQVVDRTQVQRIPLWVARPFHCAVGRKH